MWLFILFVANIVRTDLIGRSVPASEVQVSRPSAREQRRKAKAAKKGPRRLVVVAGTSTGGQVPLLGTISIGRSSDQTLTIEDDYASTKHAVVRPDDEGGWVVEDLRSTNGTFVNGVQISEPTRVGTGDHIRIGRTQMKLEK